MRNLYRVGINIDGDKSFIFVQGYKALCNKITFLTEEHCHPRVIEKVEAIRAPRNMCYTKYREYFEKHEQHKKTVKEGFKVIDMGYRPKGVGTNDVCFACRMNFKLFSVAYNLDLAYISIEDYTTKRVYFFQNIEQDEWFIRQFAGFKRCKDLYDVVQILCAEPEKIQPVLQYLDLGHE